MRIPSRTRGAGPLGAGLLVAVLLVSWVPNAGAQDFGVGEPIDLRGFATGTAVHTGVGQLGEIELADVDVAFGGAVVDADGDGVNGQKLNEMSRLLQPALENKFSYGRGIGAEVGLAQAAADEGQIQLFGKAEQDAPPDNDAPVIEELAIDAAPLASSSTARGEALARAQDNGLIPEVCVLGDDLSRGLGFVEDLRVLDLGESEELLRLQIAEPEDKAVTQTRSRTRLIPTGQPSNFGLMTESRQIFAPVTLLAGEEPLLRVEVLGEWILRAVATGQPGGASVGFGTGDVQTGGLIEDITQVLQLYDGAGEPLLGEGGLNLEQLLGEEGVVIPGDPLINVSIAEHARALVDPGAFPDPESQPTESADGTLAVGATDIVRVRVLGIDETTVLAEFRLGHMEASAQVPAGGVNCPIPVTKTADPRSINLGTEGNESEITITVHNDFDCDLTGVVLTDRIRQLEGDPDFKITEASPTPESPSLPTGNLSTADVVWQLGDIAKGEEKSVTMTLQSATKGGIIRDIAEATGRLANCTGSDVAGLAIAGLNLSGFSNPVDIAIPLAVTGAAGFPTAAAGAALSAGALALAGILRRRRRP